MRLAFVLVNVAVAQFDFWARKRVTTTLEPTEDIEPITTTVEPTEDIAPITTTVEPTEDIASIFNDVDTDEIKEIDLSTDLPMPEFSKSNDILELEAEENERIFEDAYLTTTDEPSGKELSTSKTDTPSSTKVTQTPVIKEIEDTSATSTLEIGFESNTAETRTEQVKTTSESTEAAITKSKIPSTESPKVSEKIVPETEKQKVTTEAIDEQNKDDKLRFEEEYTEPSVALFEEVVLSPIPERRNGDARKCQSNFWDDNAARRNNSQCRFICNCRQDLECDEESGKCKAECPEGYQGDNCEEAICSKSCGPGRCVKPDQCVCTGLYKTIEEIIEVTIEDKLSNTTTRTIIHCRSLRLTGLTGALIALLVISFAICFCGSVYKMSERRKNAIMHYNKKLVAA